MKLAATTLFTVLIAGCQTTQRPPLSGPALDSAAASLTALQVRMEICAHNIANAQTVGYKATRVVLEDMPYGDRELSPGDPAMARVGRGVRIARTTTDMSQGPATCTGCGLDLLIDGRGFFAVVGQGVDGGIAYTRAGMLSLNAGGELVCMHRSDARLEPGIVIPMNTASIEVRSNGRVIAMLPGSTEPSEVGQLQLTMFVNPEGLRPIGGDLFLETADSGPPQVGEPGTEGLGLIRQGMLEGSNVNSIAEQVEAVRIRSLYDAISRITFPGVPGSVAAAR